MRFFLVATLLLALSGVARAQAAGTGAISGKVLDDEWAQGMAEVLIVASGPAVEGTVATTTDRGGNYLLTGLPPGTYLVVAYGPDSKVVRTSNVTVVVGRASGLVIRFDLRPLDPGIARKELLSMWQGLKGFVGSHVPRIERPRLFIREGFDQHGLDRRAITSLPGRD
jgi:hypothetical protein